MQIVQRFWWAPYKEKVTIAGSGGSKTSSY